MQHHKNPTWTSTFIQMLIDTELILCWIYAIFPCNAFLVLLFFSIMLQIYSLTDDHDAYKYLSVRVTGRLTKSLSLSHSKNLQHSHWGIYTIVCVTVLTKSFIIMHVVWKEEVSIWGLEFKSHRYRFKPYCTLSILSPSF